MTYWAESGKYQKEYELLWQHLVPPAGPANSPAGELLRSVSNVYYDYYNNGGGNLDVFSDRVQTVLDGLFDFMAYSADSKALYELLQRLSEHVTYLRVGTDESPILHLNEQEEAALEDLVSSIVQYIASEVCDG